MAYFLIGTVQMTEQTKTVALMTCLYTPILNFHPLGMSITGIAAQDGIIRNTAGLPRDSWRITTHDDVQPSSQSAKPKLIDNQAFSHLLAPRSLA